MRPLLESAISLFGLLQSEIDSCSIPVSPRTKVTSSFSWISGLLFGKLKSFPEIPNSGPLVFYNGLFLKSILF
jgi:hypothetical protein